MVIQERHRDPYRAFFTVDQALGSYMVTLLDLSEDDRLFEPAAGDGHLLDSVMKVQPCCSITAYELNPKQIDNLKAKFGGNDSVEIVARDTIVCPDLDLRETFGPRFTKVLANPPYGGWQEYERRDKLKKRFRGFYVRETYTLFLLRCLSLLEPGGKLVFIIPNTFLYLNLHEPLRKYIFENFCVETIDVFKSSLFPGISFGYADLCIISITANQAGADHAFRLRCVDSVNDFDSPSHLEAKSRFMLQKEIMVNRNYTVPVFLDDAENTGLLQHESLMEDVADCVTGFYSGNDKRFLRRASVSVKRSNRYELIQPDQIATDHEVSERPIEGIEGKRCFVPILKGGGFHFVKPTMWYVDWSKEAVNHYKTDRKARFQNSSYYFRRGIGFPMVTSSKPTASLIDSILFDQSIVGIFPKNIELEFLLAYCNSKPFWACLKMINPSANNSARYVLRTPIIRGEPDQEAYIAKRTKELIALKKNGETGADKLEAEILESITRYVKQKASNKALEPTSLRAAAQL